MQKIFWLIVDWFKRALRVISLYQSSLDKICYYCNWGEWRSEWTLNQKTFRSSSFRSRTGSVEKKFCGYILNLKFSKQHNPFWCLPLETKLKCYFLVLISIYLRNSERLNTFQEKCLQKRCCDSSPWLHYEESTDSALFHIH